MSRRVRAALKTALFTSLRLAFRAVPMTTATRDRMRQWFLDRHGNLVPLPPRGKAVPGPDWSRRPVVRADERAIGFVPYARGELPDPLPATLVAFYLPQFHTIAENDEWWGKGFTEWRNVTRALPQFEGHHQPRLPGDLGFYDLRDPEVMREQARLAREYGIGAFCFYFYWFGGKTLLETPLKNWLDDPTIDFPFCLCWANEKWTRTWDGRGDEILIDQMHSPEDDLAFIAHVAEYMRDARYLRVDGKPLLLVYRPGLLPEAAATATRWRGWCRDNGIGEIQLAYVQSFERPMPATIGFDGAVEFPPNLASSESLSARQKLINPAFRGDVLDWRTLADKLQPAEPCQFLLYPGVTPGWDNQPRSPGRGRTYLHASPRRYRDWLRRILAQTALLPPSQRFIFVNAWNEWAEGAVLEPDARLGYAYLEAGRQALASVHEGRQPETEARMPCVIVHAWFQDVFDELLEGIRASGVHCRIVATTTAERLPAVHGALEALGLPFEVVVFPNQGRDILPFLKVAGRLLDEGVGVVLKIHTKRSLHRADGDAWRRELIERLIGGTRFQDTLDEFDQRPDLGLVGPEAHLQPLSQHLGENERNVTHLARRIGLSRDPAESDLFVPGSMFYVRLAALRPILDVHLAESDFEDESGQLDGTLAHAVERLFCLMATESGYTVETTTSAAAEA